MWKVTREIGLFILQFDKLNIVRQTSSLSLCRKREEHQREEVDSFPPGPLERWLYILQDDLKGSQQLLRQPLSVSNSATSAGLENGREREKKETRYHISLLELSHQSADGITLNNLSSFGKF
ncbi:Tetratricopeptide Repeat Protein 39A [Manis pentadactyla]|nr:Tetratricopeptide Repeat Protein 39A [Manis pentadactyla]